MRKINKVKLFVNKDRKSKRVSKILEEKLLEYHFDIVNENYDLAISIGGDGTFLRMLKEENFNNDVYYIGVNSGTLGFLQEIDIKDTTDFVKRLNDNKFKEEELSIQKTTVLTKKEEKTFYSLNEIVIRKKDFSVLKVPVYIDNELLEKFTGDGLLISTSTGSTAYNLSFGGAIIYNTLKTLSITPIAPLNNKVYQTLSNSIIIPDDKIVMILPKSEDIFLMIDGVNYNILDCIKIETGVANRKIKCLRMTDFHFIKIVNNKILNK